jgi:hypothetical protein
VLAITYGSRPATRKVLSVPSWGQPAEKCGRIEMSTSAVDEKAEYFPGLGVAAGLRFFIGRNAIAGDLETSSARRDELHFRLGVLLTNLSRQTGGSGFVASKGAVFDRDFHTVE